MILHAHLTRWYFQLLAAGPFLIGAGVLLVAQLRARRDPERYGAEAEREQIDHELDDILDS